MAITLDSHRRKRGGWVSIMWVRETLKPPPCCCSKTATTAAVMLLLLQDKKRQQQGSKRAVTLPPNRRLGVTVPCQNQGRRNEVLSRHHAEAGCVHVPYLTRAVCRLGCPGLSPFQAACGDWKLSLSSMPATEHALQRNFKVPAQVDQRKGGWSVGQARRHRRGVRAAARESGHGCWMRG